jgi:hypothetical protein
VSPKALVFAVAITAVAAPVADAHTLSKATARQEAEKAGSALVRSVGGIPAYQCARHGGHAVDCQISVVGLDGSVCSTVVRVSYKSHRSRKLNRRAVSGPDCQPPELGGVL